MTTTISESAITRELLTSELIYIPTEGPEDLDKELTNDIGEMVEALEENEDTLRVWTTLD